MGLTDLPYNACQAVIWYKSVALGDILSLKNPFFGRICWLTFQEQPHITANTHGFISKLGMD